VVAFTFWQALLSTLASLALAIAPAFYVYRRENGVSRLLESSIFIPFFFPPVSVVIAFSLLFSPNGVLSRLGLQWDVLYSLKAIVLAHSFYNAPIFVKYLSQGLKHTPPSLEDASRVDGARRWKRFLSLEAPLALPSFFKGFFLVFTYSFMSFAVVLNLGGVQFSTIEVSIANALRGQFDFSRALVYATVQFFLLFALHGLLSLFGESVFESTGGTLSRQKPLVLTRLLAWFFLLFEYGITAIGLVAVFFDFHSMQFSVHALFRLFSRAFNRRFPVVLSLLNSFWIAAVAGLLSVALATLLLKKGGRFASFVVLPVMGISTAFLATALLYANVLFSIPFPLLVSAGYVLSTLPISFSFLFQSVKGFPQVLLEAGKMDGATNLQLFRLVEFPVLLPALVAVFFQVFAIIFGEFTLPYTMQLSDLFPLASVVNYSLGANRYFLESYAFAGLNTIIVFSLFWISNHFGHSPRKKWFG